MSRQARRPRYLAAARGSDIWLCTAKPRRSQNCTTGWHETWAHMAESSALTGQVWVRSQVWGAMLKVSNPSSDEGSNPFPSVTSPRPAVYGKAGCWWRHRTLIGVVRIGPCLPSCFEDRAVVVPAEEVVGDEADEALRECAGGADGGCDEVGLREALTAEQKLLISITSYNALSVSAVRLDPTPIRTSTPTVFAGSRGCPTRSAPGRPSGNTWKPIGASWPKFTKGK